MKYILTNIQYEDAIIHYLNEMYGDLEEYETDKHPNIIFFIKDKKVYMEQELESGYLMVDYYTIWTDLKTLFGLEYNEIQGIISKWVEETYKSKGVTPHAADVREYP